MGAAGGRARRRARRFRHAFWLARRFGQSLLTVLLHPLGVVVLVGLQWLALALRLLRRPVLWKGRGVASNPAPARRSRRHAGDTPERRGARVADEAGV